MHNSCERKTCLHESLSDSVKKLTLPAVPITKGPKHHFFGYYDKHQWDVTNRYLLTHETDFINRSPRPDDRIPICVIDSENQQLNYVSSTTAWCWQQGSMLQWLPQTENLIIHNDRVGDRFVGVIIDVRTGQRRILPRPIYTVSNDGKKALSLNFSRLADTRPGYGYNGLVDLWKHDLSPEDDGIYLMDLETGDHRLIISIANLVKNSPLESMEGAKHWVNHLLFNPSDERFIFLHRWEARDGRKSRLYTAAPDGSDLFYSDLTGASHFIWKNNTHILIWGSTEEYGGAFYLIEDGTDKKEIIAKGILTQDGHCTFSPDGRWILTDQYPDDDYMRSLFLYNVENNICYEFGAFYSPPGFREGELRCDLHPRWNRDGSYISIDSVHEGERQIYLFNLSDIIK